jgi:hypothetical protein
MEESSQGGEELLLFVTGQLKNKNLLSWQTHFGRKVGQVFNAPLIN